VDLFLRPVTILPRPPLALRSIVALGTLAAALACSLLFRGLIAPVPYILFFASVAINAAYGGLWIGILSTLIAVVLANYYLTPPFNTFTLDVGVVIRALVFVFVAGLISWLSEARRQAAARGYAQAERFYVTLASIGDAVIATDADGRITFLNAVAEALTGWPRADAEGKPIGEVFQIVNMETRQPAENPALRVLREQQIVGLANHTLLIAKDGAERPIDDSGAPIRDTAGRLLGAVLVFRDMTEQRRAAIEREQLLAREQAARAAAEVAVHVRDQFLSIAAHELRTPLTSLTGQVQLFERRAQREGHLIERDRRMLNTISAQVSRLNKMVRSLLDISRIETGQLSIDRAAVDMSALVRRVAGELQAVNEDRAIMVECPEAPIMIDGDELRLEQVLQNLVQNALKYSASPAPIAISVAQRGERVCVAVRDQGMGIPESALPQLFNRFYRAENAAERHIGGIGIGLYVVKEIITLHGGDVAVESAEGAGSTFTICLPARGASAS
jgi:PAS domain S-box-containing protein